MNLIDSRIYKFINEDRQCHLYITYTSSYEITEGSQTVKSVVLLVSQLAEQVRVSVSRPHSQVPLDLLGACWRGKLFNIILEHLHALYKQ